MKSVWPIFLKVLLLVSLAATPVTSALAVVPAGNLPSSMQGIDTLPCLHATQKQAPVGTPQAFAEKIPCTCYVDDCASMDDNGCQHVTTSPLSALPSGTARFPVMARDHLVVVFQRCHSGLNVPPESPPPIV